MIRLFLFFVAFGAFVLYLTIFVMLEGEGNALRLPDFYRPFYQMDDEGYLVNPPSEPTVFGGRPVRFTIE